MKLTFTYTPHAGYEETREGAVPAVGETVWIDMTDDLECEEWKVETRRWWYMSDGKEDDQVMIDLIPTALTAKDEKQLAAWAAERIEALTLLRCGTRGETND
jgi:hypothetical protein